MAPYSAITEAGMRAAWSRKAGIGPGLSRMSPAPIPSKISPPVACGVHLSIAQIRT